MRALIVAAALIAPAAAAACEMTVAEARARLADGVQMIEASRRTFYFLEGVWAMNPATPPGLPPDAGRAFLMRKAGKDDGDVVFATAGGDDASCLVGTLMPAPKELRKLIDEIEVGPGEAL